MENKSLTQRIVEARAKLAAAKEERDIVQESLNLYEAGLYLTCDYNGLGSNDAIRKRKYLIDVLQKDPQYKALSLALAEAQSSYDAAKLELEQLEDWRRKAEFAQTQQLLELRERELQQRARLLTVLEQRYSAMSMDEFETAVGAELYFES